MKIINLFVAAVLGVSSLLVSQQPQSQDIPPLTPPFLVDAATANGTAPGYAPKAATTGLVLSLGGGTANCSFTIVTYAAGTLTMANNTTNYVYLNSGSSCVPASNTSGFTSSTIPIAVVTTSGGNITSILDVRSPFSSLPAGAGCSPNLISSGCTGANTAAGAATNIVNGNPVSPSVVNGMIMADQQSGADWVAKVNTAIAALPSTGGTVFIANSLSGSTGTGSITVPSGVYLWFDAGLFTMTGSLIKSGVGGRIGGVSQSATTILFTGATDGFVNLPTSGQEHDSILEDLTLETSNASGGAAFRADSVSPGYVAPTTKTMRNVNITTIGGGNWAYGMHLQNFIFNSFYSIFLNGSQTVAIHADCATSESGFYDTFIATNGVRGLEMLPGDVGTACGGGGNSIQFHGGGFQGSQSASEIFNNNGNLFVSTGTHSEVSGSYSDGASIVIADAGFLATDADLNTTFLTTYTSIPSFISIKGGTIGAITLASQTVGSIVGVNYVSLNTNGADISVFGNKTQAGTDVNTMSLGSYFNVHADFNGGTVTLTQGGTPALTLAQGTTNRWTLPSSWQLAWGAVGSEDTWLSRPSSGVLHLGTTPGATDGTLVLGEYCIGSNCVNAFPTSTIVGTTDTQTLVNKTVDGVTPTTFSYVDPTSSIQGQLNTKVTASGPTVGQAACIKAAGPPVVIGYCSTIVGSGGACTCN